MVPLFVDSLENFPTEITSILRRRYLYCVYCGFSYNDEKDLEENCPGNSYQLHD